MKKVTLLIALLGLLLGNACAGTVTFDGTGGASTVTIQKGTDAPVGADYLVGTANATLTAEIAVGTTPGGELGNTWASPTIDDSVTVTGWTLGASVATTPAANDADTSLATTAFCETTQDYLKTSELPGRPTLYLAEKTILDPDNVQATLDAVTIFCIEAEAYPNGITIVDCGIKTSAASTYSVVFEEWSAPGTATGDLETVATSGTLEAEDNGAIGNGSGGGAGDCNAGSIIKVDLPATAEDELVVWFTYSINMS